MTIWMTLLLCLSLLGYSIAILEQLKVRIEFIPIYLFSSITLLMFVSGLFNFMPFMDYLIVAFGIVLLGCFVLKKRNLMQYIKAVCIPGVIIIFGFGIYFLFQFRGMRLIDYDEFSHWALVIKEIVLTDRLPDSSSVNITFQAYPVGSALFIYFVNKLVGFSEGRWLFAQMMLILSCLLCLFAFCNPENDSDDKKIVKQITTTILLFFCSIYLLNGPYSIYTLLVDTLVLLFGLAGLAIIVYYKDDLVKAAAIIAPIMGMTVLIKNSGIFYVFINLLYMVCLFLMNRKYRQNDKKAEKLTCKKIFRLSSAIILPVLCLILWHQHVRVTFPNGELSRHAMSIDNFKNTFSAKSDEEIMNITDLFIKRTFDIRDNTLVRNIIFWNIGLLGIYLLLRARKQKERALLLSLTFVDLAFVLYLIGLYIMYLVSMPVEAAKVLAEYARYLKMGSLYLEGYLMIQLVLMIHRADDLSRTRMRSICAILCVAFFFVGNLQEIMKIFTKPQYIGSRRQQVESAIVNYNPNASYVLYAPNSVGDGGYLTYLLRYILSKNPDRYIEIEDPDVFLSEIKHYDFLVIIDEDDAIRELMEAYLVQDNYVGTYPIQETFGS